MAWNLQLLEKLTLIMVELSDFSVIMMDNHGGSLLFGNDYVKIVDI